MEETGSGRSEGEKDLGDWFKARGRGGGGREVERKRGGGGGV